MSEPLRCVIAGYGYMGEIRKRVVEAHPALEMVGVADPDPAKRAKVKGCPTVPDYRELLALDPELVFVCTPNRYAPAVCIESLKRGKHVFCEKPPGRNLEEYRAIMSAETPKTKLMFGFNHRFHPGILKAKVLVDSGRLGRVLTMRAVYGKSGGVNFGQSWRNDKGVSGGGILLDQGIHMLDLFRHFCGDLPHVKCFASNAYWKFDVEDNAVVILANDQGQNAMLHSSATQWKHTFHLTIILEEGYLVVEGLLSKTGSYGREKLVLGRRQFEDEADALGNPSEEVTYFDRDLSWELEVDEFVRCVLEDKPVSMGNSLDALRVMEIVDKSYRDAHVDALVGGGR